ncbi:MAG: hypothetical protein ACRCXZ_06790 [Patescibacteria group bacterium]
MKKNPSDMKPTMSKLERNTRLLYGFGMGISLTAMFFVVGFTDSNKNNKLDVNELPLIALQVGVYSFIAGSFQSFFTHKIEDK